MRRALLSIALLATLALVACSDDASSSQVEGTEPVRKDAPTGDGRALRSSIVAQARAALPSGSLSRSMRGLTPERRSDGIVRLRLPDRFEHASVAVLAEDGVVRSVCIDGSGEPSAPQVTP